MSINELHRKNIVALYCIIFYALLLFKWWGGLFLYQLEPVIYQTRFDFFTWQFMQTGLHTWLLNHRGGLYLLDALFYSMPLMYWLLYRKSPLWSTVIAIIMLVINWVYIQCYTLYPTSSIESFIGWLLFPVLFITTSLRSFYFVLHALRYFFLFLFASAGLWKLVQQGIFNVDQMSGVLLYQHKEFLTSAPDYWLTHFFYWMINHPLVGYLIYVLGTLLELSFLTGFFTRKFDRILLYAFILFLLLDLFLMRIYYWELSPFMITLIYSRYRRHSALK